MKTKFKFSTFLFILLLTYFISLIYSTNVFADSLDKKNNLNNKHILILNSYERGITWSDDVINGIVHSLKNSNLNIDIKIEYMDIQSFSTCNDSYLHTLYDLYNCKYSNQKIDLIIPIDDSAFNFLLKYNKDLFNNTPIVFCGVNYFKDSMLKNQPMFTGIVQTMEIKDTLDLALSIHPNKKNILIFYDNSITGLAMKKYINELIPQYNNSLNFIFINDLNILNNKTSLNKFNDNSIALLLSGFTTNNKNNIFLKKDNFLSLNNFNIPFYTVWDSFINNGIVGGKMLSGYTQGMNVATIGLKILHGENPKNIPINKNCQSKYTFDYNKLKKFNISLPSLPYNKIIINLPPKSYKIPRLLLWLFIIICISMSSFLIINISEKRRATAELIENAERLRTLINASPDLICLKDTNGKFLEINEAGIHFFNLTNIKWKSKTSKELSQIEGSHKNRLLNYESSDKIVWEKNSIIKYEQEFSNINEDNIFHTIIKVPLFHSTGTPKNLVIIGHDITYHIRSEKSKKLLNEMVEYENLRTDFFANISHELRTPLNVILSALQYIEFMFKTDNNYKNNAILKKYSDIMKQNSYRLVRILNNLIDITKLDSGYFKLDPNNYNIVEIIEEICLSVAPYIESKNLSFLFDTEIEEKIIACDADLIERIMFNLLSNSIKFTNSGGQVTVNIYDKIDTIQICVKDTGIGIPKDKLSLIFERFVQVDKSLSRKREGSGIGLSLVKSLTELHGGQIQLKSEVGKGSEFIISLPVKTLPNKEIKIYSELVNQECNTEKMNIEFSDIYS